jgi:hypothetical protein
MKFDYFLDQKVTTWYRTRFEINANNQEEADEKAKEFIRVGNHSDIEWEQVDGVIDVMTPEINDNQATEELFQSNGEDEKIWDNLND